MSSVLWVVVPCPDAIQEGTTTKNSRQIRREIFGMGGSLSAGVSQDYTSLTVRGLSEFAPPQ